MFVVTTAAGGRRDGCLVGFLTQSSIDPARLLVCLSDKNRTCRTARAATHLGVHVLDRAQLDLAALFGSETGDEIDKFERCGWDDVDGVPVLHDAPRYAVGRILETAPWGDHIGFHVEPAEVVVRRPCDPLMFSDVRDLKPGHDA